MNKLSSLLSLALFFLLFHAHTSAQIKIEGVVRDARSKSPLQFVVVSVENANSGDVTGERGSFSVSVSELPVTLTFRLIGYEKISIQVVKDKKLNIELTESVVELNTVEIRASQLEKVAGTSTRSIWDYAWSNGQLIICDYGTTLKSAELFLLDEKLDTVDIIKAPAKPVELFTDCMGNAHFVGKDSTWQIVNEMGELVLLKAESNYLVENILRKCTAADEDNLYFQVGQGAQKFNEFMATSFSFESNDDVVYYFYGPRDGNTLFFLTKIEDDIARKMKDAELNRDSLMHSKVHGETYDSGMASKYFFYTTLLKEIYCPMFSTQGKMVIVDYVHGHWVEFDEGMSVSRVDTLQFNYDKRKPHRCITDEEHHGLYVLVDEAGIVSLHVLNQTSIDLGKSWTIPHTFPDKVTVRNGYAYYIHRDPKDRLNRYLSRLKLD